MDTIKVPTIMLESTLQEVSLLREASSNWVITEAGLRGQIDRLNEDLSDSHEESNRFRELWTASREREAAAIRDCNGLRDQTQRADRFEGVVKELIGAYLGSGVYLDKVNEQLDGGNKIPAVKILRDNTGFSLLLAKMIVEAMIEAREKAASETEAPKED